MELYSLRLVPVQAEVPLIIIIIITSVARCSMHAPCNVWSITAFQRLMPKDLKQVLHKSLENLAL
jgi:hypothetical protein